ncbi:MAG: SAM-dependent methyltransferase, partial [Clostridia bacterium]|nr:SAM-dependent methyltransferase [Clostridia bacterium]
VDAPCSGEGMFHKEPSLIKSYLNKGPKEYAKLQKEIISAAAKMLKPGGMMLYSTCTFSPLEDEETISYLLTEFPEISLVSIKMEEGFKEGLAPFKSCVRLYPHQIEGEGHFVALLQKKPVSDPPFMMKELHTNGTRRKNASLQIPKTVLNELYYFCKDLLNQKLSDSLHSENLFMKEQMIYLLPEESSPVPGIRYLRTGLLVGEIGKNHKFFPSQAFAMTLSQNDYRYVFDLKLDDPAVIKYLKGESIQLPDSYAKIKEPILITVDGYSLGWGLSNHGLLKNKYAKGWRMQ